MFAVISRTVDLYIAIAFQGVKHAVGRAPAHPDGLSRSQEARRHIEAFQRGVARLRIDVSQMDSGAAIARIRYGSERVANSFPLKPPQRIVRAPLARRAVGDHAGASIVSVALDCASASSPGTT